jgi:hypothetical protein
MSMNTLEIKVTMVERSRTYYNAVGYLKFYPDVRVDDSRRAGICQHADRANNGNTGGQRDDGTARATNGDDSDDFTVDILVTSTVTTATVEETSTSSPVDAASSTLLPSSSASQSVDITMAAESNTV